MRTKEGVSIFKTAHVKPLSSIEKRLYLAYDKVSWGMLRLTIFMPFAIVLFFLLDMATLKTEGHGLIYFALAFGGFVFPLIGATLYGYWHRALEKRYGVHHKKGGGGMGIPDAFYGYTGSGGPPH